MEKEQKELAIIEGVQSSTTTLLESGEPAMSVSGTLTPKRTSAVLANLQGESDVIAVEAAIVGVKEAYRLGDRQNIEEALIDQAALLQALAVKLLTVAGDEGSLTRLQVFTNLSLRAFEGARKTLAMLAAGQLSPQNQTNVQVNVGGRANELPSI